MIVFLGLLCDIFNNLGLKQLSKGGLCLFIGLTDHYSVCMLWLRRGLEVRCYKEELSRSALHLCLRMARGVYKCVHAVSYGKIQCTVSRWCTHRQWTHGYLKQDQEPQLDKWLPGKKGWKPLV